MRPVSSRTRSSVSLGQRPLDLEVGDAPRAARRCRSTSACATRRSRPSGASIVPARAGGRPSTSARYSRVISRAAQRRPAARAWAASSLATTSRPRVSRSSRCTIPARSGPPRRPPRPASACDERPAAVPARRMDDDARRLVDDEQVLVLLGDRERRAARRPRRARGCGLGRRPRPARRRAARGASAAARRRRVTRPGVDQPLRRASASRRRRRGRRRAARRRPAASTSIAHVGSRSEHRARAQRDHAERDRDVGDVERRPVREA